MGKEKKEIGKLIELLNEYDSGWDYDDYYGPYQYGQDRDAYHLCKYQLVSKEYGFIKWLVENDKIRNDIYRPIPFKIKIEYEDGVRYIEKLEDRILVELSVSDTPIEDLISYLK